MNRHFLAGRYGLNDKAALESEEGEVLTEMQLVSSNKGLDHGLGRALRDLTRLGIYPSEIGLDLLVLAAHVHAADTRVSRATESQDTWTREIRLLVPVSDVALWMTAVGTLERMLNFLTGDRWKIGFRGRPKGFSNLVPKRHASVKAPPFNALSLFSGGMDSLIGAIDLLESGSTPLLVSHAGEGATSDAQTTLFEALRRAYSQTPLNRFRLWMNFPKNFIRGVAGEDTTRGRSFLFFAAGVAAGTGLSGSFSLLVPENGLIALNVPLDPLRLGSLSTRTTHPFYMARWNELIQRLGITGGVRNPFWDKTKGEMTKGCSNQALLGKLLPQSLSCSSPTKGRWKGRGVEHCGYCLPCLIRRAAVKAALAKDETLYTLEDLRAAPLDTRKAEGQQVRSFQYAVERLARRPGLASVLIHKAGPLTDPSAAELLALSHVYGRGMDEVGALLSKVRTSAL